MVLRHWVEQSMSSLQIPLLALHGADSTTDPTLLETLVADAEFGESRDVGSGDRKSIAEAITEWWSTRVVVDRSGGTRGSRPT